MYSFLHILGAFYDPKQKQANMGLRLTQPCINYDWAQVSFLCICFQVCKMKHLKQILTERAGEMA
jgi:hypothetical protein